MIKAIFFTLLILSLTPAARSARLEGDERELGHFEREDLEFQGQVTDQAREVRVNITRLETETVIPPGRISAGEMAHEARRPLEDPRKRIFNKPVDISDSDTAPIAR